MADFTNMVPLPARTDINTGFSPARQSTMLNLLGTPGALTENCSNITNPALAARIKTKDVGPFRVTGLDLAIASLEAVFDEVKAANPELYNVLGTAGMTCCRAVRHSHSLFSNHSWGTAIDIKISGVLTPQGARHIPEGLLLLYPHFHTHGWFWAAGYRTLVDPMHFELADETIQELFGGGRDADPG